MKKHEIIFSIIKIPLDFLSIFASFFIARNIREINDFIPWMNLPSQVIPIDSLFNFALFWSILFIIIFSIHWLYSIKLTNSKISEILDIIFYSIYWFLFFSVFVYFWQWVLYEIQIPRLIILFTLIIWLLFIITHRIIINKIQNLLINNKLISKRKILLINNKNDSKIKNIINDIEEANIYEVIWYISKEKIKTKFNFLWDNWDVKDILTKNDVDEIIFIDSSFSQQELYEIWDYSRIYWIRYRYITNNFDVTRTNTTFSLLNKIPLVEIKTTPLDSWWRVAKRTLDILSSFIWLIVLSPLFIIVWILIKIEDPKWPIIYKNKRVWQYWKKFNLYKFRYLKWEYCTKESYWIDNKDDKALRFEESLIEKKSSRKWPLYKIKNDPRKTKVWTFIEKYSIDELPQLINVLIWNMSLVWPRPHQPREVQKYKLEQKRVLTIKPWITWIAQVNWRDNNKFEDEVKMDIFYIENWSMLLDIKILLKTIAVVTKR